MAVAASCMIWIVILLRILYSILVADKRRFGKARNENDSSVQK